MLAHKTHLVSKSNPLRYMMRNPIPSSRLTRWILALSEFDIQIIPPTTKKSQALAELLAAFPTEGSDILNPEIPGEPHEVMIAETELEWQLFFDGSASAGKGGLGVVLISPESTIHTKACKLMYGCSNNEAEYEALIAGLELAAEKGAKNLNIQGDSRLVVQQLKGEFAVKEPALTRYRARAQQILQRFQTFHFKHIPRSQNRYADALATLASRINDREIGKAIITIEAKQQLTTRTPCLSEDQWIKDTKARILGGKTIDYKLIRHFHIEDGVLYYKSPTGVLARCLSKKEARKRLDEVHDQICGMEGAPLARRLQ
ncbi:hypothetical protein UlMin_004336 [Ulmus minor]